MTTTVRSFLSWIGMTTFDALKNVQI
jgi:hypothetical protein